MGNPRSQRLAKKWALSGTESAVMRVVTAGARAASACDRGPEGCGVCELCAPSRVYASVMVIFPQAPAQHWHQDIDIGGEKGLRLWDVYETCIIPITNFAGQGGTVFLSPKTPPDVQESVIGAHPRDVPAVGTVHPSSVHVGKQGYRFNGSVPHYGSSNLSGQVRVALMMVVMRGCGRGKEAKNRLDINRGTLQTNVYF
eukprot:3907101-Rhodomonas_salina.1